MRILLINSIFYPAIGWGGPITATYDLARKLVEKGHDVTVYTSNARDYNNNTEIENEKIISGIKIRYFKNWSRGIKYFFTPGMIIPLLRNVTKFDVVHINSYRQFQDMISFIVCSILQKPFVLTSHGYVLPVGKGQSYKKFYDFIIGKKLLSSAKRIIAFHEKNLEEFTKMGVKKENIKIIPNAIDIETLPQKGKLKKILNIPTDSQVILYLGRIEEEKGVGCLIKAFSKIKMEKVYLIIAGSDFQFLNKAKDLVKKLGIESITYFIGLLDKEKKLQAFSDADIVVCPSLHEAGFSLVVLESAASAKPLIISDSIGFSEEILLHNAGIVFPPKNVEKLTEAMKRMLQNLEEANAMGVQAQEIVKKKFSWNIAIQKHLDVYLEVINN